MKNQTKMALDLTALFVDYYKEKSDIYRYLNSVLKDVYYADNGINGLTVYENKHPDIIITKIQLPSLNGLEFLREIRKISKTIPVILIVDTYDPELLLEIYHSWIDYYNTRHLYANQFITKPLSKNKLYYAMQNCCKLDPVNYLKRNDVFDKTQTAFLEICY